MLVDRFGTSFVFGELTDGIWDLFGQNGDESSVHRSDTFGSQHLGESGYEAVGILSSAPSSCIRDVDIRFGQRLIEFE